MTKRANAHVVLKGSSAAGGAECLHCGAVLLVVLPCRVDDWCDAVRKFEARHRDCPPPEEAKP